MVSMLCKFLLRRGSILGPWGKSFCKSITEFKKGAIPRPLFINKGVSVYIFENLAGMKNYDTNRSSKKLANRAAVDHSSQSGQFANKTCETISYVIK